MNTICWFLAGWTASMLTATFCLLLINRNDVKHIIAQSNSISVFNDTDSAIWVSCAGSKAPLFYIRKKENFVFLELPKCPEAKD